MRRRPVNYRAYNLAPSENLADGPTEKARVQMNAVAILEGFKRAPSVEMSTWYKGILTSNLATERDTGGAFEFVLRR
jgi:hypothetical protein